MSTLPLTRTSEKKIIVAAATSFFRASYPRHDMSDIEEREDVHSETNIPVYLATPAAVQKHMIVLPVVVS